MVTSTSSDVSAIRKMIGQNHSIEKSEQQLELESFLFESNPIASAFVGPGVLEDHQRQSQLSSDLSQPLMRVVVQGDLVSPTHKKLVETSNYLWPASPKSISARRAEQRQGGSSETEAEECGDVTAEQKEQGAGSSGSAGGPINSENRPVGVPAYPVPQITGKQNELFHPDDVLLQTASMYYSQGTPYTIQPFACNSSS